MRNNKFNSEVKRFKSEVDFEIKASDNGLLIEGFANKNVVDRGNERIDPKAWQLENFMKNPVILFNHGLDPVFGGTPIGKAIAVEPRDDGLFIKVRMSNSKSPLISMVRDLVDEKILRTFSVGFDPKDEEIVDEGGDDEGDKKQIRLIKSAELFEVSVVGIPMNQDSVFELSGKMLKTKSIDQIKTLFCEGNGATVATTICKKMTENARQPWFNRQDSIRAMGEMSETKYDDLMSMLAGLKNFTDMALRAACDVLDIEFEKMEALNSKELASNEENSEDDQEPAKEPAKEEEKPEAKEEEKPADEDKDGDANNTSEKSGSIKETIEKLVGEGMAPEDAVAKAFSEVGGEPTKDEFKLFLEFADSLVSQKQADQDGVDDITVPIKTTADENDFGSPFLEQAKQTNVLLGTLASKLDALTAALTQTLSNNNTESVLEKENSSDETIVDGDSNEKAVLDNYKKRLEDIKQRIKSLK